MGWTFLWLMLALKIPIGMLLYLVWWAAHQTDEEDAGGEGGAKTPASPHPRFPHRPRRRGPHGDPVLPSPPRSRTSVARADVAQAEDQEPEPG